MTGPKLNERSTVVGERSGTKATAKYVRTSASKARAVLDLVRGIDVSSADEILQFTQRHVAHDVRKVLASAVANAINNDGQEADELFIVACFADEGPTLRRFRPRARGRATRINKRTCHITVIVARMSDERLEILRAREERTTTSGRPQSSAASRRARVERSRLRASEDAGEDTSEADEASAAEDHDVAVESDDTPGASDEAAEVDTDIVSGSYAGSAEPHESGDMPDGYPIKGNEGSMLYHEPDSRYYKATKAEVWFDSVESAEAAGFSAPGAATKDADEESPDETGTEGSVSDEESADEAAAAEGSVSDEESADEAAAAEGSASDEAGSEPDQTDDDEKN